MASEGNISVPMNESASASSSSRLVSLNSSRLVERAELQGLNDRLAGYIDRMMLLETENSRLNALVQASNETRNNDIDSIKQMYAQELTAIHKLLNEVASEKTKLEIKANGLREENEELKIEVGKKSERALKCESSTHLYKSRYNEINCKYKETVAENKKIAADAEILEIELNKIRVQYEENHVNLKNEILARVDLENAVRNLREELELKIKLHTRELNEARTCHQADMTEINSRLAEQYKADLQESLKEIRDQYEEQMRSNRDEIESLFDGNIKNGQNYVQRDSKAINAALDYFYSRKDDINVRVGELEQSNSLQNFRIRELQSMLDGETARSIECEAEINRLRAEMALQLEKYQYLMNIKVSLDMEIATYDKLLCNAERRLEAPAAKRIKSDNIDDYSVTSTSIGDIEISEIDPYEKFIKLHNKSQTDVALSGWQLIQKTDAKETVQKFDTFDKIVGGGNLVIWSADIGVCASPGNIIMDANNFLVAEKLKTTLINPEGQVEAATDRIYKKNGQGKCLLM